MTSEKKIKSNRRNALKSTGARTKRGKKHSSLNALRFGLYARPQVLPGESDEEHRALLLSLTKNLKPQGPIEEMYVTQIEGGMRRLKRADLAEHSFIGSQVTRYAEELGDRNSEGLRMLALGPVLAAIVSRPFDINDKVGRLRKRIIRDIQENLEALQECQVHRAIEVQSQWSERRVQAVERPRLLTAPVEDDTAFDVENEADDGSPPLARRPRKNIAQPD